MTGTRGDASRTMTDRPLSRSVAARPPPATPAPTMTTSHWRVCMTGSAADDAAVDADDGARHVIGAAAGEQDSKRPDFVWLRPAAERRRFAHDVGDERLVQHRTGQVR